MKRLILIFIIFINFSPIFGVRDIRFIIEGEVPDKENGLIEIYDYSLHNIIDTCRVQNGKFRIEGSYPRNALVRIECDRQDFSNCILDSLIIPNFKTHLPEPTSDLNKQLIDFWNLREELYSEIESYRDSIKNQDLSEEEKQEKFLNYYKKKRPSLLEFYKNSISASSDPIIEIILCSGFLTELDISSDEWEEFYTLLPEEVKQQKNTIDINSRYIALKSTLPGCQFIDIEGKSDEGESVSLSDFVGKGKYILVDFWASWCSPCIAEGKDTLIPLYEKYSGNPNFDIIGVATWDELNATKASIIQHGYKWPQILDAGMAPMEKYGFDGIPMLILFDPDGIILERGIRGPEIEKALQKYL